MKVEEAKTQIKELAERFEKLNKKMDSLKELLKKES
jgi:outer membrane murein-binding lipoprotein Lpp